MTARFDRLAETAPDVVAAWSGIELGLPIEVRREVRPLRCGEWLLFAGIHDLMHLEQLEALEASLR
jgi:hypothetical protein